jgi:hypothetical protein
LLFGLDLGFNEGLHKFNEALPLESILLREPLDLKFWPGEGRHILPPHLNLAPNLAQGISPRPQHAADILKESLKDLLIHDLPTLIDIGQHIVKELVLGHRAAVIGLGHH